MACLVHDVAMKARPHLILFHMAHLKLHMGQRGFKHGAGNMGR